MRSFIITVSDDELRREKAKARVIRQSQWWKRLRSEGVCFYCRRKFPPGELTMDHLVPLIRGGKSSKGNIVPACKKCNNKKKYLLPLEWEEYLESLHDEEE